MSSKAYSYLIFAFSFYLFAQAFQQVVLLGPLSSLSGLDQTILESQHPANLLRHFLIYTSMYLLVPAFILLGMGYWSQYKILAAVGTVFFIFFCFIEIAYRSVHIFQVLLVWGKEYAAVAAVDRPALLPKFQYFFGIVEAIYVPLLLSLMLGSLCLFSIGIKDKAKLLTIAMGVSTLQQVSRLMSYTPFDFLNVFIGIWYFVPVAITFGCLIATSIRWRAEAKRLKQVA